MLKYYVEFLYPGIIVSENSSEEINHTDALKISMPEHAFAFRFYEREERQYRGETLVGKAKNHTPWFMEGEELSLDEVKSRYPNERVLITNLKRIQPARVCRTKFGQFIPLRGKDQVLNQVSLKGNLK